MNLEISYGDLLHKLVVKCGKLCYEMYFECQNVKNCLVMFYDHLKNRHDVSYSLKHLIIKSRDPVICFIWLINGCIRM